MNRVHPWLARIVALLAVIGGLPCAAALAQPPVSGASADAEAGRLYLAGAAAYGDGRYAEAARAFEEAFALAPEASLLYNLAFARQREGETARAIDAYERFLASSPDAPERTEVERSLESLRREQALHAQLARQREPTTEGATLPAETSPTLVHPSAPSVSAAPWIVCGVGVASVIAGSVLGVLAQSAYDDAQTAISHAQAFGDEARANDLALGANIAWIAGGVLAVVGAVWGVLDVLAVGRAPTARSARLHLGLGGAELTVPFDW